MGDQPSAPRLASRRTSYYLGSLAHERALTEAEERAEADLQGELPCMICSQRVKLFAEDNEPGLIKHIVDAHPDSPAARWIKDQLAELDFALWESQ